MTSKQLGRQAGRRRENARRTIYTSEHSLTVYCMMKRYVINSQREESDDEVCPYYARKQTSAKAGQLESLSYN